MDVIKNNNPLKLVVVGGSGHLGSEICRQLAEMNCSVVLSYYKNKDQAEKLSKQLNFIPLYLNLEDLDNIKSFVSESYNLLGRVDGLIFSSGIATSHYHSESAYIPTFFDITGAGFDKMVSINVKGVFFLCQEISKIMIQQKSGKIVITGSIDGVKHLPAPMDYACCKSALYGFTQSLAKELGKYNILVNMVAPGILEGGISDLLKPELREAYLKHSTMKRPGTFSEIAKVVVFLISSKNTYLTGQAIILDGGL